MEKYGVDKSSQEEGMAKTAEEKKQKTLLKKMWEEIKEKENGKKENKTK